jgi:hypothetical protein
MMHSGSGYSMMPSLAKECRLHMLRVVSPKPGNKAAAYKCYQQAISVSWDMSHRLIQVQPRTLRPCCGMNERGFIIPLAG